MKNVAFKGEIRCFFQPSSSSTGKGRSHWLALMVQCEARNPRAANLYSTLSENVIRAVQEERRPLQCRQEDRYVVSRGRGMF